MEGSLINRLYEQGGSPEPTVGMGGTVFLYSDRHAVTVTGIVRFKSGPRAGQVKAVTVRRDRAIRVDGNGMSDAQAYRFEPDESAPERTYTLRKDGTYRTAPRGSILRLGARSEYYDYSF